MLRSTKFPAIFTDLDDDVLDLIIKETLLSSYQSSKRADPWALGADKAFMIGLSLTCKKIRACMIPWLFREITWPGNKPSVTRMLEPLKLDGELPEVRPLAEYPRVPDVILPHIRRLLIRCHRKILSEPLLQSMPQMTSLASVIFDCKFTPPVDVLGLITRLPSVVGVGFLQTPLDFRLSSYEFVHLEHLSLRTASGQIVINNGPTINAATSEVHRPTMYGFPASFVDTRETRAQLQNTTEMGISKQLMAANISSLQLFEVNASLLQWREFEKMEWPCLHTFVLFGSPPVNLSRPIVSFLRGMKSLTNLQFHWVHQKGCLFKISPDSTSTNLSELFPALTSLTVTNPTPSDQCYAHLPPALDRLFLPVVYPEYGSGLSLSDARSILRSIAAGPAMLSTLHFQLRCFTPLEIIQEVAQGFPKLHSLEIGTMYNDHDPLPNTVSWDVYADALSPLVHLQKLRIAPQFKSNGRPGCLEPILEEIDLAILLAKRVTSLRDVAFQSLASAGPHLSADRSDTWNNWTTYEIVREKAESGGKLTILCDGDVCEGSES